MKYPYCAEELKDKAIICRYCGQNLSLMKDNELLQEEVSSLEKRFWSSPLLVMSSKQANGTSLISLPTQNPTGGKSH
jgi:hypothetical protein